MNSQQFSSHLSRKSRSASRMPLPFWVRLLRWYLSGHSLYLFATCLMMTDQVTSPLLLTPRTAQSRFEAISKLRDERKHIRLVPLGMLAAICVMLLSVLIGTGSQDGTYRTPSLRKRAVICPESSPPDPPPAVGQDIDTDEVQQKSTIKQEQGPSTIEYVYVWPRSCFCRRQLLTGSIQKGHQLDTRCLYPHQLWEYTGCDKRFRHRSATAVNIITAIYRKPFTIA